MAFEGVIRVRRYLCRLCKRTVDQPCLEDQAWPVRHKALKAAVAASKKAAEQEKIAQLMLETPVRVPPSLTPGVGWIAGALPVMEDGSHW